MSSIIIAEAPDLSKDLIRNGKCSIWPPLSASNIKGFVVVSIISFNDEIRAEKSKEEYTPKLFSDEPIQDTIDNSELEEDKFEEELFDQDPKEDEDFEIPAFLRRQKF